MFVKLDRLKQRKKFNPNGVDFLAVPLGQRSKLLCLMKILYDKADRQNPMTINAIIKELNNYGIKAERKSIYTDFDVLRQFGMNIEMIKTKTVSYYLANRIFEVSELELLKNAIQSVDFRTKEKSNNLMNKLFLLATIGQAKIIEETKCSKTSDANNGDRE